MANPQTENGYTKIANELLDALCASQLSGHEWSVVHAVIRKTYGYNKKEDWVTNTQIAHLTGLNRHRVSEAKAKLLAKGIVTEKRNKISLDKDYEKWSMLRKNVTPVTENRNKVLRKTVSTKDNKDNIQKTGETSSPLSEKDMSFNIQPDNPDEDNFIDFDGTGEVENKAPARQKKYPNAPAVRRLFQEILGKNPANWRQNKTQLIACENLYTERGLDKIRNALEFYKEHEGEKFCPIINSPHDLDSKYPQLSQYKTKNGT